MLQPQSSSILYLLTLLSLSSTLLVKSYLISKFDEFEDCFLSVLWLVFFQNTCATTSYLKKKKKESKFRISIEPLATNLVDRDAPPIASKLIDPSPETSTSTLTVVSSDLNVPVKG